MNASDDMNISPEPSMLDGNAAAGLLQQIFAVDVTRASITCVACESVQPTAYVEAVRSTDGLYPQLPSMPRDSDPSRRTSARVLARLPRCLNATSQN